MKMSYSSQYRVIMFTLIKGATTNNYGPISLPTLGSYSIFFGGNNSDIFSNLVIRAPDAPMVPIVAHFTTPPVTLYVGYPAPKLWLSADYSVGSSDISADVNTTYSTTDAGVCDVVSFGGVLTPIAAGVCQIIATNSLLGIAATQTVTVVSTPPSSYLANTFVGTPGLTVPTNMYVNLGRFENKVNFTTNGIAFQGTLGDPDRSYFTTAYNAYDGQDFQADVDVIAGGPTFGRFFGIGRGEVNTVGQEPQNSAYIRLRQSGGQPNVGGVTSPAFTAWPGGVGTGPVHLRMLYTVGSGVVSFTISTPTTNQSVSVSMTAIQTAAAAGGKGLRIFIGGSGSATVFDTFTNLVIKAPSVIVTNLYFGNATYTNLLVGQTTTPAVQVLGNRADGTPQDVTALSTFAMAGGTPVSVSSAGLLTVQDVGADAVIATYVGPAITLTATQAVAVLAPTAVRIDLPQLYEGCRPAIATLRADFTPTITNVDVTAFNNSGSWAAQGLGYITVAGNEITPVLAGGPEELTAQYHTLIATNPVTVLAPPPFYRTDSFTGSELPAGYYLSKQDASSPGATVTPSGTIFKDAPAGTRDYVISAIPFYDQSNFVATLTVKTNANFGAIFGIGRGLGLPNFGEPTGNSLYFRSCWSGANPDVQGVAGIFTKWPAGLGNGPFTLRISYVNDTVNLTNAIWFTIITGDTNETIGPFTLPAFAQGYSIFFGGAELDRAMTFANLSISATAPGLPAAPTLDQSISGSDMTLTWSDGFLLHATDVIGPWSQVVGANSPYAFTVNPTNAQEYFRAASPYVRFFGRHSG
jgi:hypothetical protein